MRIAFAVSLCLLFSGISVAAPAPTKTPIQKVEERLAALEAENKALKDRIEALEKKSAGAAAPEPQKDGGQVVKPAAIRVGMPIGQAVEIARMNGSSMVKLRTSEDDNEKIEIWRESYSIEVPDLSGEPVERRFTEGFRVPTKSKPVWARIIKVTNGKVSSID